MSTRFASYPDATGFILAGGKSRRFGEDKALFTLDGEALITRPLACLNDLLPSVAVIAKHPPAYAGFGVPVLADTHARQMPHVGVLTGLEAAETGWSVFLACDMPSITTEVVRTLLDARASDDGAGPPAAVVPETPGGVHPLAGCYHRRALPMLRAAIENEWSLRRWVSEMSTRIVSFDADEPFRNVNRKSDLPGTV